MPATGFHWPEAAPRSSAAASTAARSRARLEYCGHWNRKSISVRLQVMQNRFRERHREIEAEVARPQTPHDVWLSTIEAAVDGPPEVGLAGVVLGNLV